LPEGRGLASLPGRASSAEPGDQRQMAAACFHGQQFLGFHGILFGSGDPVPFRYIQAMADVPSEGRRVLLQMSEVRPQDEARGDLSSDFVPSPFEPEATGLDLPGHRVNLTLDEAQIRHCQEPGDTTPHTGNSAGSLVLRFSFVGHFVVLS
jgi:hypothetical protein